MDRSVILYSTGDLLDDYAIEPTFRNDRQLLFDLVVTKQGIAEVRAFPIELDVGRTYPAGRTAREWIERRFRRMCSEVGSRIVKEREWLAVLPSETRISRT